MHYLNTLYVMSDNSYLNLEGETAVVTIDNVKKLQVPLHHLESLVLQDNVRISSPLLNRCAKDGRSVVFLTRSGRFGSRLEGPRSGNVLLRIAQFKASECKDITTELCRSFIYGKLANSRQVLLRAARQNISEEDSIAFQNSAEGISKTIKGLRHASNPDICRGYEGQGAAVYFSVFGALIKPQSRAKFTFVKRQRRPPPDPVNALLSYAYALLLADCRSALESVGLDPQIGFLHGIRPGRLSLALDLMEEFRPILADRLALTLVNRKQIQHSDFAWRPGGNVELSDDARKIVINHYQQRKKEHIKHSLLKEAVPIGVLPMLQARLLARTLRGDMTRYHPFLYK